jgi:hypothetical protein
MSLKKTEVEGPVFQDLSDMGLNEKKNRRDRWKRRKKGKKGKGRKTSGKPVSIDGEFGELLDRMLVR